MTSERIPALTFWQPWASLVIEGVKPFEFRGWEPPLAYRGKRIAIHAGARPARKDEISDLIYRLQAGGKSTGLRPAETAIRLLERYSLAPLALPLGAVLGTAILGKPVRAATLAAAGDSARVSHHVWAWPLTEIEACLPPVPARGGQGFWMWREEALI